MHGPTPTNRLIDTHCHLDAAEFDTDRDAVALAAQKNGVTRIVVPAVERANFETVVQLSQRLPVCAMALGIHPLYTGRAEDGDLDALGLLLDRFSASKQVVAVGEIGLDFFVENQDVERQESFFCGQLRLARDHDLPVILHVRRAVDAVLKNLRRFKVRSGIAHAFNGSRQQADEFIKLGFKLGFGGAMTFDRALRIRQLATELPLESIVLETDAPDISPEWIRKQRNSPAELARIAQVLADLRQIPLEDVAKITTENAQTVLPNLLNTAAQ
ncbi:MAG TPA: TatD family hydrolase [Methylophilaceae bacterium]